jgi:RND superfamily putative drug exporter
MFCALFGLSMDYEVFLLSRIREAYQETHINTDAVAIGLERSGSIITSAAAIVILVSLAFASADMLLVKALGIGMALAVLVDATLVRGLLVPATMRLLGDANWWWPWPLSSWLPANALRTVTPLQSGFDPPSSSPTNLRKGSTPGVDDSVTPIGRNP